MENCIEARLKSTDILKGIGIILVILNHVHWGDDTLTKLHSIYWIYQAVPIFLIVMGIHSSISFNKISCDLYKWYSFDYFCSKLKRILIPFTISYVVFIAYYFIFIGKISFMNIIRIYILGGGGPGGYYIPLIITITSLFPIIYCFVKNNMIVSCIVTIMLSIAYEWSVKEFGISDEFYRIFFMRELMLVVLGIVLYLRSEKMKGTFIPLLIWLSGLIYLISYEQWGMGSLWVKSWISTSFLSAPFAFGIVYAAILFETHLKIPDIYLGELGRSSFHIFLVQKVFFSTSLEKIISIHTDRKLMIIIDIIICLGVGYLFYQSERFISRRLKTYKFKGL